MPLLDIFDELPDPRAENRRYPLPHLVFIAVCMTLCNADDWEMVSYLAKKKLNWLRRYIPLPHGVPSHDTFSRVFSRIDPQAFNQCFITWTNEIAKKTQGEVIAIDGKTLRRSYDRENGKAAIHMVNAWASQTGMVMGQLKTAEKSNEITAIPQLLDMLEISGCIISIDAMGCQKSIAQKIIEKEGDYLLAVKGNQGHLYDDIKLFLDDLSSKESTGNTVSYHETLDKDHGRIEIRRCWVSNDIDWLDQKDDWKNLTMIGVVEGERHEGDQISIARRYFISSLKTGAEHFMDAVRSHWSVENNLHWVLDIGFREDENRIRKDHGPENMAIFRQMAINLLKQEKSVKLGVKNRRTLAAADDDYRDLLLQGTLSGSGQMR